MRGTGHSSYPSVVFYLVHCLYKLLEDHLTLILIGLNLGLPEVLGLGRANVPEAEPAASVVKAAPADEPVGVTKDEISIPSKNGYILVNGFIAVTLKAISFDLIN